VTIRTPGEHQPVFSVGYALCAATLTVLVTTGFNLIRGRVHVPIAIFGGDPDKVWVVILWLCALAAVIGALILARGRPTNRVLTAAAVPSLALAVLLAFWQDPAVPLTFVGFSWIALGVGVLAAAAIVVWVVPRVGRPRLFLVLSTVLVSAAGIWPLLETPATFASGINNAYVFSELLAPATGRMPGFDFASQYENLLGYPLAIAAAVFPAGFARAPEWFAVVWLVVLQVVTLGAALLAVERVAPKRIRWWVPLVVIPIAYLAGAPLGLSYFAALPIRTVLPTVLLLVMVYLGMRNRGRLYRWWVPASLGLVAGITALNNLDFGIPALLACLGVVVLSTRSIRSAALGGGLYLVAAVVVPAIYAAIGTVTGRSIHLSYLLFFVRNFGVDGIFDVSMPVFGLYTAIVFIGVVGLALGVVGVRLVTGRERVLHQAILFQSAWLLLSLVYFSGRSLTQTLVIGSAFQVAVLVALLILAAYSRVIFLRRLTIATWSANDWISVAAFVLLIAIPIASLAYFPSPVREVQRLGRAFTPSTKTLDYLVPDPTKAVAQLPAGVRLIGLLSVSSAMWGEKLGIPNADLYSHPAYLNFNSGSDLECAYLTSLPGHALLTTHDNAVTMSRSAVCTSEFDFSHVERVGGASSQPLTDYSWVLLTRRSGGA
jgi:hypothetical protein